MAAFLTDSFTGTNGTALTAHAPETGGAWVTATGGAGLLQIQGNRIVEPANLSTHGSARNAATPPSADYYVEAVFVLARANNTVLGGITGRHASGADTFYWAAYDKNNNRWQLLKRVAGVNTSLGTFSETLSAGNSRTVRLRMEGTSIKLYVNGVERIAATDSSITATGFAGVCLTGAAVVSSDGEIDSITADGLATAWSQPINDSVTMSDAAAKAAAALRTDSVTMADALVKAPRTVRTEALALDDAMARAAAVARTEALTLADATAKAAGRTTAEVLALADSRAAQLGRAVADTLGLADGTSYLRGLTLALGDPLGLADSPDADAAKSVADTLALVEALTRATGTPIADSVSLADARLGAIGRIVAELLGLTDARVAAAGHRVADTVGLADNLLAGLRFTYAIADSVSMSDAVAKASSIRRADAAPLVDAIDRLNRFYVSLSEPVGVAEGQIRSLAANRTLADAVALLDASQRGPGLGRADALAVSDSYEALRVSAGPERGFRDEARPGRVADAESGRIGRDDIGVIS